MTKETSPAPVDTGAGAMRARVTLRRPVRNADAIGGTPAGWEEVATVWAAVEAVEGSETVALQAARPETMWKLTLRWRGDVKAGWSVLWQGRVMTVIGARPADRARRRLVLVARETGSGT